MNPLKTPWIFWIHDVKNENYKLNDYKKITTINTIEEYSIFLHKLLTIKHEPFKNMLFFMRDGITPLWEDPNLIHGGFWSFKIPLKFAIDYFLLYIKLCIGETICENSEHILGISISPKLSSCTLKIWANNTNISDISQYAHLTNEYVSASKNIYVNFSKALWNNK